MKTFHQVSLITAASLILLGLTACAPSSGAEAVLTPTPTPAALAAAGTADPGVESNPAPTSAPTAAEPTPEPPSDSPAACLIGKWQLSDFSAYFRSLQANIESTAADITVNDLGQTGTAYFTFNADGSTAIQAEDFRQSFSVAVNAGGSSLEVPASVTLNGLANSDYTVSGDTITFTNQQYDTFTMDIEMMDSTTAMTPDFFGSVDETAAFTYTCTGNTLTWDVILSSIDLAPVTLTRVN
jgi:hypothetical protein